MAGPAAVARSGLVAELGRLLALLGATGVAITQPLLDVFGKSPETFIFRHAHREDLVVFALFVALVPPLVVWLVGVGASMVRPRRRLAVQGASVGLLAGLAVVQVLAGWPFVIAVLVAV